MTRKMIANWRYYPLAILAAAGIMGIISEPTSDGAEWTLTLIVSKSIGAAAIYAAVRLYKYWDARGEVDELKAMEED